MQDQVNILVVDDEPGIRTTLSAILEEEGYNVVVAEDGYKGIEAAKKTKFKIAFLDLKMPGINGVETFKRIKKISPNTIIFFTTAFFAEDLLKEAVKLGAQAILYKPLDIDLILKVIKEDLTKTKILVVDDEFAIREPLKGLLEDRGYKVTVAEDGHAAIEMAKKTHFDIMFIDVEMPGIDGLQTLEEIKKVDPKTKVVVMTGHDVENLTEKAISRGATTCIPKPIDDMDELLQLLQTIKEGLVRTNILVVDDEFSTRETLKGVLEDRGYKVAAAEDGLTAIEMAKKTHFDVMFIDVVMPGIDGFKTLEGVKKVDPKTKLVMMTGHDIEDFVE
ncbi:MAG TPA: response regulator, partial [Candidatus Scalindua sp.]|nr:response regulator [Candidatus Scalindua sp.]